MLRKRIALYLNGLHSSGGMERVVSNLLTEWCKKYDVIIITKNNLKPFYPLPSNIIHVSLNCPLTMNMNSRLNRIYSVSKNLLLSIYKLRKSLQLINADYYYVANPLNAFEFYCAMRKDVNKKLVISEHASIYSFNSIYMWMKRIVYPKAYCISVPNSMDIPIYKVWGCNALYIPHQITYEVQNKNKLDTKIILNVGRLTADKQQDKLIRMWSRLPNREEWQLWIVGNGEEKENLSELVKKLHLEKSVKLLEARKDIVSIYKQASVFVLSSRCEGFGMVLLEAMAFGIPCISFDCPSGPRDIIQDGLNGFLIQIGNEEQYVEKLQKTISMSTKELRVYGEEALSTISNWDNKGIINSWSNIFK